MLKGKYMALNTCIIKQQLKNIRLKISELRLGILQFKTLGKEEQIKPKVTRRNYVYKSRN